MKKLVLASCAAVLAAPLFAGNVYYASPDGTPDGDGSEANPYDIVTACSKLGDNTHDEVKLLSGTYKVGSATLAAIDYYAKVTGVGQTREDVVLDGEGAGKTITVSYGSLIQNVTFTNYAVQPLLVSGGAGYNATVASNCVFTCVKENANACQIGGNGDALLVDCLFKDNESAPTYGCAVYASNSKAKILRCTFVGNKFTGWSGTGGGAIYSQSGTTVDSCVISNNSASAYGGGITVMSGGILVTNTQFYCNTSTANGGGGLFSAPGAGMTNTIVKCVFRENHISTKGVSGAAVRIGGSGVTVLKDCAFEDNLTDGENCMGAAIWGNGAASAVIEGCTFAGNRAVGANNFGGGCEFETYGDGILIQNCTFSNNLSIAGGALAVRGPGSLDQYLRLAIVDTLFVDNVATNYGGAFGQDYDANARVGYVGGFTNCVFKGNRARSGCAFSGVGAEFSKCSFVSNRTESFGGTAASGGAIYVYSRGMNRACNPESTNHLVVVGCGFTNNYAAVVGAGFYCSVDTPCTITDSTFYGNISEGSGSGGAVAFSAAVKDIAVDRCAFWYNGVKPYGGAFGIANAGSVLERCIIRNSLFVANTNRSDFGGALSLTKNCEVANCTFVQNVSHGQGGAVYSPDVTDTSLCNCLFYGNRLSWQTTSISCDIWAESLRANATFNCCSHLANFPEEHGNIVVTDPKFMDAAAGDFRLAKGSPCVDAGVNEPWMAGARDLRNKRKFPRIVNEIVDMGCYEYRPDPGLMLLVK